MLAREEMASEGTRGRALVSLNLESKGAPSQGEVRRVPINVHDEAVEHGHVLERLEDLGSHESLGGEGLGKDRCAVACHQLTSETSSVFARGQVEASLPSHASGLYSTCGIPMAPVTC